jgi:hypothetical protein
MAARIMIALLAMMLGMGTMGTAVLAGETVEKAVLREGETDVAIVEYDDDDGGDGTGNTGNTGGGGSFNSGTGNSNDGTNSKVTPVTKDKDRSHDDLTKDRTKDGPGGKKRDWSKHQTNDSSKNDSR